MQKSSWMMLLGVAALAGLLAFAYITSHSGPGPLTETQAHSLLESLKDAMRRKDVNGILSAVSPEPETRIANMSPDKLRAVLQMAFRSTDDLDAQTKDVVFQGGDASASMEFDLNVRNTVQNGAASHWTAHVTLQMRPVDVPQFLGLYHTKEWRIVGAISDGPDLSGFGE